MLLSKVWNTYVYSNNKYLNFIVRSLSHSACELAPAQRFKLLSRGVGVLKPLHELKLFQPGRLVCRRAAQIGNPNFPNEPWSLSHEGPT